MRRALLLVLLIAAVPATAAATGLAVTREHVRGDVYHYTFDLRVGDGPNARLAIHRVVSERAPWRPRRAGSAILFTHGDFSGFWSNFHLMAPWLAERSVDVWGLDRRYVQAPAEGADVSDFEDMGVEQMVQDIGTALAFARSIRFLTDGSPERIVLSGFSRGALLTYIYAAVEGGRPAWQRQLKGIVPLDVYAAISPANPGLKAQFCAFAAFEYELVAAGEVDSRNDIVIELANLARSAPDEPTPFGDFFPGRTNRGAFLDAAGITYATLFGATPWYHLAAPTLDGDGVVTGLSESDEAVILDWFAASPVHSSMREAADTDAYLCGEAPLPIDAPLSNIRVPVLAILAAGGYGDRAIYTTTQLGSSDVTVHLVRHQAVGDEVLDVGHGDLLFGRTAATDAWQPLLSWLRDHE